MTPRPPSAAPRLVVRVLAFSFGVIACVLAAVLMLVVWQSRQQVTRAVVESVEAGQRHFAALEARRSREQALQALTLSENPTLKAAVDTYQSQRRLPGTDDRDLEQLIWTVESELAKVQQLMSVPAVAVTDVDGRVVASVGPFGADWPAGLRLSLPALMSADPVETVITRGDRVYLATIVPMVFGSDRVGETVVAHPLDDAYAEALAEEAVTDVALVWRRSVVGSSLAPGRAADIDVAALPENGIITLGGEEFVVRRLSSIDSAEAYALGSLTAASRAATSGAGLVLLIIAGGAVVLAAAGSWWLARTVAAPIDNLTTSLAQMARERDLDQPLPQTGTSRELDTLSSAFDELRYALKAAEAESEATYLGVIGTLAAALDARDPYTSGHSQRVAYLSVTLGRALGLPPADLDTLRLGALLHDIGKIGVADAVLRKPGTLTPDEFNQIKQHTTLGARILKPLRFLDAHIAIVELHHERPDGRGYPQGLRGDEIPLLARIVHVADAFDAMTTARPYRPGRAVPLALEEIQRHAGTDFDVQVAQALAALPASALPRVGDTAQVDAAAPGPGMLVRFRGATSGAAR